LLPYILDVSCLMGIAAEAFFFFLMNWLKIIGVHFNPYTLMNSMCFFFLFFKWPAPLICSAKLPIHFFELLSVGEIGRDKSRNVNQTFFHKTKLYIIFRLVHLHFFKFFY
jgi:hypothetical protein